MNYITPELLISIISGLVVCVANTLKAQASTGNGITAASDAINATTNKVYL